MACLKCKKCLDYVDGELSIITAPDAHIDCVDGQLTSAAEIPAFALGSRTREVPDPACNELMQTTSGDLWAYSQPKAAWTEKTSELFAAQSIAANDDYISPAINVDLPANPTEYTMTHRIAATRWCRVDQSGNTNITIHDRIAGVNVANYLVREYSYAPGGHFTRVTESWVTHVQSPPGAPAGTLDFAVRVRVGPNTGMVWGIGWHWSILSMAIKDF